MKNYDNWKLDTPKYLDGGQFEVIFKIYCNADDIADKIWDDVQGIVNQYNRVNLIENSFTGYFNIILKSDIYSYIEALESDLRGYLNNYHIMYEVENG